MNKGVCVPTFKIQRDKLYVFERGQEENITYRYYAI